MRQDLDYAVKSHVGYVRVHNEDHYLSNPDFGLWIVADGMGGHLGGEVASKIAVEALDDALQKGITLKEAIQKAHVKILETAEKTNKSGMGTTVVGLQIKEDRYRIFWIGDSRAYFWDGKRLKRLTRDHSLIQEMIDNGIISDDEARTNPKRNIITRALGMNISPEVEIIEGRLIQGTCFLLCTDGLNSELYDDEIAHILKHDKSPAETVKTFTNSALQKGGHDNITVAIIKKLKDIQ